MATMPNAVIAPMSGMTTMLAAMLIAVNRLKYHAINGNRPTQAAREALVAAIVHRSGDSNYSRQRGISFDGNNGSEANNRWSRL
jgi:hypothetical protein